MSRSLLLAVVLVAAVLPFAPTAVGGSCQAVAAQHVGDSESVVDPIFLPFPPGTPPTALQPNCCLGPTVPLGDYYVSLRTPVQYRMYHEPHVNGKLFTDPATAISNGAAALTDPRYELVSAGSTDVVAEANGGVWIYQETNGQAGLQRGGTFAGQDDACLDPLAPGVIAHDTIVL